MTNHSQGSVLHFFAEGNTARGSINLFESSLQDLNKLYILKGGPGTGKSSLIRSIGQMCIQRGYDGWQIHCARDHRSLDGWIIPALKLGIVDGTVPHVIEPRLPGVVGEYINLGDAWNPDILRNHRKELEQLQKRIDETYEQAYAGFAEALRVHDDWEAVYIKNMDFEAANRLTKQYIEMLFGSHRLDRTSRIDRRFLGAATPDGAVDFVPNLTEGINRRYFIKGRPGSGKSTMLKQMAEAATERGFDVEIYHCGFDPNSVDMIIVRALGFAVFDSTKPHEYFPERSGDVIIDMYETCIRPGTDERHAESIQTYQRDYSAAMKHSIERLRAANDLHQEMEQIYVQAMDFSLVNQIRDELILEIQEIMSASARN